MSQPAPYGPMSLRRTGSPVSATQIDFTCPMHAQIVQKGPGTCPICGMSLEPKAAITAPTASAGAELASMKRRFFVSLALAVPLFVASMANALPGEPVSRVIGAGRLSIVELALATPVVAWGGWPFFVRGARSVRLGALNMFTLIAVGTGAAFLYSVVATLAPSLFPPSMRGPRGVVDVYFEAAAVVTTLVLLGQVLELRAPAVERVTPSVRSRSWRRRPLVASARTAQTRTCPSRASPSATDFACARVSASQPTGSSTPATPPSTSR